MARSFRQQTMVMLAIALCLSLATAQTFQYSRGWTNGRKRSDSSAGVPRTVDSLSFPLTRLLPASLHQNPAYQPPAKTVEERLRALEAGFAAVLKASSANLSSGGDDEYYSEN
ncbi:pro-corazonin-like [Penaeus japonicus]|uniref:pro-corazonin-like n=1 Tax=Penaeus japonicus TaxID=27405 RepID=UPI001C714286|nr:pro-corazonin-like [Penaeus japonicus]